MNMEPMQRSSEHRTKSRGALTPLGVVAAVLAPGVLARTMVLIETWHGGAGVLLAVPVGLGPDALVGLALATLVAAVGRASRRAGVALGCMMVALHAFVCAVQAMSFRLVGDWIRWTWLGGEQGVGVSDVVLLEPADAALGLGLAVVGVGVALLIVLRLRWEIGSVGLAVIAAIAVLLATGEAFGLRHLTRGLGQNPLCAFAHRSGVPEIAGAVPAEGWSWEGLAYADATTADTAPPPVRPKTQPPANAVLYLAEGTPWELTSLGGAPLDTTPNLKRRAAQGLVFTRYYATQPRSMHAIFSVACSAYPPPSGPLVTADYPRVDCGSLTEHFAGAGFAVALFHAGHFSMYDKMAFFHGRGLTVAKDALELQDGDRWITSRWGIDDRAMVDAALAWLDTLPSGQRFFLWLLPLAPHYPSTLPHDLARPFHESGRYGNFVDATWFADQVFERLMRGLEARGRLDDTLVVWTADHGESIGPAARHGEGRRLTYEEQVHVPLVLWYPPLVPTGETSARLGGHVDLMPTLLDLFDLPPDPRHLGQSLLAAHFRPERIFAVGNHLQVAVIDGAYKAVLSPEESAVELFDLESDPAEQHDLATKQPLRTAALSRIAKGFASFAVQHLRALPKLVEADPMGDIVRAARVSVATATGTTDCLLDAEVTHRCPGQPGWVFAAKSRIEVMGRTFDCLRLHPPNPGGRMRADLSQAPLSDARAVWVGLADSSLEKPGAPVHVVVTLAGASPLALSIDDAHPSAETQLPAGEVVRAVEVEASPGAGRIVCVRFP